MSSGADAHNDIARVADGLRTEFRRKLTALRSQLHDEIRQASRAAEQRAKETGTRLDAVDERLALVADAQTDLRQRIDGALRAVRQDIVRLGGEIHLIESRLRAEHGVVPVDLDTVPVELAHLVAQVREAEDIRGTIMDDESRAGRQRQVDAFTELERKETETRSRAFDASRALATGKPGGRAFRKAAAAFRYEREQLRLQGEELRTTRGGCESAKAALVQDARQRQRYRAHRGAAVADELATHVRGRIDEAVAAHELFPAWFTITELGHRPPAARAALWRDVASQVVLYRITYQVDHPVLALGPAPQEGHRAERHAEVLAVLRRLVE